jgi:polysaccharide export outer membrane protein
VQHNIRLVMVCIGLLILAGCSLPRGAAMSSEILKEQDKANPQFQVVHVSTRNVVGLQHWPATGWQGGYQWLSGGRGAQSQLIQAGDKISLAIWDSQENSLLTSGAAKRADLAQLVVSSGGTIFIPYLGEIAVRNMTPEAARSKIQEQLEVVVPSAQVQLTLEPGQQNSVHLVSGVAKPGTYPLPDRNYSLLSLLAQGGGIQPSLRNPVVRLIRSGKTYEIRADRLMAEAGLDLVLRGNDKVLIEPDRRFFTALGATGREELLYFDRDKISAMEALSMIGGLSDARANVKSVLVLREYPTEALRHDARGPEMSQVIFAFDLSSADGLFAARKFPINPQDTVFATESSVTVARTILGLIGSVVGVSNAVGNAGN